MQFPVRTDVVVRRNAVAGATGRLRLPSAIGCTPSVRRTNRELTEYRKLAHILDRLTEAELKKLSAAERWKVLET
jgi:hypothetical protein